MNEPGRDPSELPLGRLEAFSDGVFAIAITLYLTVPVRTVRTLLGRQRAA